MPRGVHATRVLPTLGKRTGPHPKTSPNGPKLYNAKRRVQSALGVKTPGVLAEFQNNHLSESWRDDVSPDVAQFVDDMEAQGTKLLPEEQRNLLVSPAHYFSRPQNVPTNLREQVYFPNFSVTMRRQTIYGPDYAQFEVPLWFSKLDLKGYLKQVYNVDVVHIRSYTTPAHVSRKTPSNPYTYGEMYRLKSRKRMTVQLVEPFEWPVKPEDVDKTAFESDRFWDQTKMQNEETKRYSDLNKTLIDRDHRKSIAEQAQELLARKAKWGPTWESLPNKAKLMEGLVEPKQTRSLILPNITKADASKGRSIRVF